MRVNVDILPDDREKIQFYVIHGSYPISGSVKGCIRHQKKKLLLQGAAFPVIIKILHHSRHSPATHCGVRHRVLFLLFDNNCFSSQEHACN